MFYISVNGSWTDWAQWTTCGKSCDGGVRTRTRQCNDPLPMCDGLDCVGNNQEYEPCNNDIPCTKTKYFFFQIY